MKKSVARMAKEIERYCAARPKALDTLEGIIWWVTRQRLQDAREDVQAAVSELVRRGTLTQCVLADGTVAYRYNAFLTLSLRR